MSLPGSSLQRPIPSSVTPGTVPAIKVAKHAMERDITPGIILRVHVWPEEGKETELYASLRRIEGPTRARLGCRHFSAYRSWEGSPEVVLIEEWQSPEGLGAHIRSSDFRVVLALMDASTREPVFRVDTIGAREGFERVAEILRVQAG